MTLLERHTEKSNLLTQIKETLLTDLEIIIQVQIILIIIIINLQDLIPRIQVVTEYLGQVHLFLLEVEILALPDHLAVVQEEVQGDLGVEAAI